MRTRGAADAEAMASLEAEPCQAQTLEWLADVEEEASRIAWRRMKIIMAHLLKLAHVISSMRTNLIHVLGQE